MHITRDTLLSERFQICKQFLVKIGENKLTNRLNWLYHGQQFKNWWNLFVFFKQKLRCDILLGYVFNAGGAKRQLLMSICSTATVESHLDRSVSIGKLSNAAKTSERRFATQLCTCKQLRRQHITYSGECKTFFYSSFHRYEKNKNQRGCESQHMPWKLQCKAPNLFLNI